MLLPNATCINIINITVNSHLIVYKLSLFLHNLCYTGSFPKTAELSKHHRKNTKKNYIYIS